MAGRSGMAAWLGLGASRTALQVSDRLPAQPQPTSRSNGSGSTRNQCSSTASASMVTRNVSPAASNVPMPGSAARSASQVASTVPP